MAVLRLFFNVACFLTTFGMIVLWIGRYIQDEDKIQLDVRPFDLFEGQYPMLSFCLFDPFIDSKLREYNATLTGKEYSKILRGEIFYNGIEYISFDNVTLDLKDFYLADDITFGNLTYRRSSSLNFQNEVPQMTYSGFLKRFFKCFGLKSKFTNVDLRKISYWFNTSVFRNGIHPLVFFHLPNQLFLVDNNVWIKYEKDPGMIIHIKQIEILKRRNKRNDPCISDNLNFDQIILDDHLQKVGCKAPNQKTNTRLKTCDSKEAMKMANSNLMQEKKLKKSCNVATALSTTHRKMDIVKRNYSTDEFHLRINYPLYFKETMMLRAVDMETVIANAGGYIGLFLGMISVKYQTIDIIPYNGYILYDALFLIRNLYFYFKRICRTAVAGLFYLLAPDF